MPRNRLTRQAAFVTGADRIHPARHAGRANPRVDPLGDAPDTLSEAEKRRWREFADDMPWLARSDRNLTALACRLAVLADAPPVPLAVYAQLRLYLASMGATPVDRSKVQASDDDTDPAAEFLQ